MMAELYGRANGASKGKDESMHLVGPKGGVMGASAVVASTIRLAVGAALANQLRRQSRLSVMCFGDGATFNNFHHSNYRLQNNFSSI
jgi:pyruvate dehydrogenase E1 component alpha subunit